MGLHSPAKPKAGLCRASAVFCLFLALYVADVLAPIGAQAVDFTVRGQWIVGLGLGDGSLLRKSKGHNLTAQDDRFAANQRFRLQLEACASELLRGTIFWEIGDQPWGRNANDDGADVGGALGADGSQAIKVKNAYLEWIVPNADLTLRMGLQNLAMPHAAGGSAILDCDLAGIVANLPWNDNFGLTLAWLRPLNDNFAGWTRGESSLRHDTHFLDNLDLLAASLPITFEGVSLTPWVMYGMLGQNALSGLEEDHFLRQSADRDYDQVPWKTQEGDLRSSLTAWFDEFNDVDDARLGTSGKSYYSLFFAGLPLVVTAFEPWRFELDINYGFVESIGSFTIKKNGQIPQRASSQRQGWLVKALVEYTMDWGVPGIMAWYATGDDGDVKNGSERLPSIAAKSRFTTFSGYGGLDWGVKKGLVEWQADYAGTWGVGLQLRDSDF